jgi:hypothetical protein
MNFLKDFKEVKDIKTGVIKREKIEPFFQDLSEEGYSRARFVAQRMLAKHMLRKENKFFRHIKECVVMDVEEVNIKDPKITLAQAKGMSGVELLKVCAALGEFFKAEFIESEVELKRKCLQKLKPYFIAKAAPKPRKKITQDMDLDEFSESI